MRIEFEGYVAQSHILHHVVTTSKEISIKTAYYIFFLLMIQLGRAKGVHWSFSHSLKNFHWKH